ncbi:septum formation family protein [Streptomyces sp. NBC_00414]|uniref:septum formation family protein n=1 Tax=Streptomyces sp. NBC_00414 TaxID=2975739 RepID=UPI002E228E65
MPEIRRTPSSGIPEDGPYSGPEVVGPTRALPLLPLGRTAVRQAVAACVFVLALTLGGISVTLSRQPSGEAKPYGPGLSLDRPLMDGDCVSVRWPSAPFTGEPELKLVKCLGEETYGQVMATVEAATAAEARLTGPGQCERLTAETREKLAAVRSYAAVPTRAGFEAAGRRTACLILDARGKPLYGPIGEHRPLGTRFTDTATMQKRDCLDRVSDSEAELVSCEGPHDEQVLGFHRMSPDTTLAEARRQATEACQRHVPPGDHGYDPKLYEGSSWVGRGAWASGTHFVVCTAIRKDGSAMEKDEQ